MGRGVVRKVGGSLAVVIPAELRDSLGLVAGSAVRIAVEGTRLVIEADRPRYKAADLLAEYPAMIAGLNGAGEDELAAWRDAPAVGEEIG
jgi:AbrB family looped-hinge helix DNA binding protein